MAHDVFISYSSRDKPIADGICANLESAGLRCWIAPRDIAPGEVWPAAISRAISKSRVMVLVFSSDSNASDDVGRELMLAANSKLVIIPFKIENIEPEPGKQYYLARTHWLDAVNPPTRVQIHLLVETVKSFVATAKPVRQDNAIPAVEDGTALQAAQVPTPRSAPPISPERKAMKRRATWLYSSIPLALIALAGAFYVGSQLSNWRLAGSPTQTPMSSEFQTSWVTAISTETPTLTQTPISSEPQMVTRIPTDPIMDVEISDTFLSNAYDWPLLQDLDDEGAIQNMRIQDDELRWSIDCVLEAGCFYFYYPSAIPLVSDFDVSVDIQHVGSGPPGYVGLVFRVKGPYHYYMFTVDDEAGYFLIWRLLNNVQSDVVAWTPSNAIRTYQVNRLAVSGRGTSFTFSINGSFVARSEIKGLDFGYIGIQAGTFSDGKMTTIYDNFELRGSSVK